MDISREFTPVSKAWQIETCNELGISFVEGKVFNEPCPYLGEPTSCYKIIGDGNCLFRRIALAVSGNEEIHRYFRNIIPSFIVKNQKHIVNNDKVGVFFSSCHKNDDIIGGILENLKSMCFFKSMLFLQMCMRSQIQTSHFFSSV